MDAQVAGLRDGEAESLERSRIDEDPAVASDLVDRPRSDASPDPARARRQAIEVALAEKVLRSHLHNNLQISFPLVLNLANQSSEETAMLMEVAAEAVLSGGKAAHRTRTTEILGSLGTGPEAIARFEAAVAGPRPLSRLVEKIAEAGLAAYAYAVALVVTPRPNPAEAAFLDYLAARLELGADIVSGISRRYRR